MLLVLRQINQRKKKRNTGQLLKIVQVRISIHQSMAGTMKSESDAVIVCANQLKLRWRNKKLPETYIDACELLKPKLAQGPRKNIGAIQQQDQVPKHSTCKHSSSVAEKRRKRKGLSVNG